MKEWDALCFIAMENEVMMFHATLNYQMVQHYEVVDLMDISSTHVMDFQFLVISMRKMRLLNMRHSVEWGGLFEQSCV
jgi:hypothetical protein